MNLRKLALNKIKLFVRNFFLGIFVGFSDLFPAISGSTILMIFGKYFELLKPVNYFINSIFKLKKIDLKNLNIQFTLPLTLGIIFSIFTFSRIAEYLFDFYKAETITFISSFLIIFVTWNLKKIEKQRNYLIFFFSGILISTVIYLIPENFIENTNFFVIFISGILAMAFMIIPGISGSLILIVIGSYERVISAISNFDFSFLIIFSLGGIAGLMISVTLISKIIYYLKTNLTIFFYGLILGSIPKFFTQLPLNNYYSIENLIYLFLAILICIITIRIMEKYEKSL
tara:strand:+ start:1182 stop:2039 length:858 start_codon:yes stop_codon:yes gene_type:complete